MRVFSTATTIMKIVCNLQHLSFGEETVFEIVVVVEVFSQAVRYAEIRR